MYTPNLNTSRQYIMIYLSTSDCFFILYCSLEHSIMQWFRLKILTGSVGLRGKLPVLYNTVSYLIMIKVCLCFATILKWNTRVSSSRDFMITTFIFSSLSFFTMFLKTKCIIVYVLMTSPLLYLTMYAHVLSMRAETSWNRFAQFI